MQEDKSQLFNYAMFAGVYLGVFWIIKYLFIIGGTHLPLLNVVNSMLSIGTPLLLYYFLVRYKTTIIPDNNMKFWHGVQFGIMLFFFASVFEALIVFIHVKWIDPGFIGKLYENMLEVANSLNFGERWTSALTDQPQPTPFNYIFSNVIMADVFIGLLLSCCIVPLVLRFKSTNSEH